MARMELDLDLIRSLAAVLDETGLSEIEVESDDQRIRIARQVQAAPAVTSVAMPMAASASPAPNAPEPRIDAKHPGAITSPMVGTAYLSVEPGAPAFVKEGDRVAKGDTLLIVEAMKVMNRILAPRAGTVSRIIVVNESPVEFGEVLMLIE